MLKDILNGKLFACSHSDCALRGVISMCTKAFTLRKWFRFLKDILNGKLFAWNHCDKAFRGVNTFYTKAFTLRRNGLDFERISGMENCLPAVIVMRPSEE